MTIGWIIEWEEEPGIDLGLPSRVGWGQTLQEARTMTARMVNVVDVDTNLAALREEMREPVRWRLHDSDGNCYYKGVVERSWVEGTNEDGEDYAYGILKFGQADTGATDLLFAVEDLRPEWVESLLRYSQSIDGEMWVPLYG
jgi:hypothetical protein